MANTDNYFGYTLDETDIAILRELQNNGKLTTKELANEVNLSMSPVFERQKRLEKLGFIKKYVAVLDPKKLGYGMSVICNIRLKQHSRENGAQFVEAISKIDEVTDCWNTSGDYDFMIRVYTRDMEHYQQFVLNVLGDIESIGSLHSIFVIGTVKSSHALPLPTKE
ncbi:MAG: Lrp/AsnC family transcriptional regulator [Bacteroidales bacterium]|nr:Lrp/AsnC family transcriptional regulator [Bacteroidales bacterium]